MYSACLGRTNFRPGSKFGLTGREVYDIGGIEKGLKPRQEVTVKVTRMVSPHHDLGTISKEVCYGRVNREPATIVSGGDK